MPAAKKLVYPYRSSLREITAYPLRSHDLREIENLGPIKNDKTNPFRRNLIQINLVQRKTCFARSVGYSPPKADTFVGRNPCGSDTSISKLQEYGSKNLKSRPRVLTPSATPGTPHLRPGNRSRHP